MIRINKNNLVFHPHYYESKPVFVEDIDLPRYLSDEVKIGKNVTFERIFDLFILHKDLFNLIFEKGTLYGYKIENYLDDYNKPDEGKPDSMTYLEIHWGTDFWDFEGEKEIALYPDFHGIKENYTDENQKEPCTMPMGLDFTPICELKKYKVRLSDNAEFRGFKPEEEDKFPILLDGKKKFTLFDVITAIFHEISFYGTPENRQEQRDKLDDTVKRIESGEEKLYEWKGFKEDGSPNFIEVENPHKKDK